MKWTHFLAVGCASGAAALAAYIASGYVPAEEKPAVAAVTAPAPVVEKIPMTTVVTLAKAVPFGHKFTPDDFKHVEWPKHAAPAGAYRQIKDVFAKSDTVFAKADLSEGEVLMAKRVSDGQGTALSMLLPPDKRAVTIKVNEIRGVGGFIQPKDHVDILLTEKAAKGEETNRAVRVLLENIMVLAIGQDVHVSTNKAKVANSVTVAVSLHEAQRLALAVTVGELSLALRNPNQVAGSGNREISLSDLQAGRIAPKPKSSEIEVFRSTKATSYAIPLKIVSP